MADRSARSFSRSIKGRQRLPYLIAIQIDGTTATPTETEGGNEYAITDNGVGDWTITFSQAFQRAPVVTATTATANSILQIFSVSASAVRIKAFQGTDGTTAVDVIFHALVMGFDATDVI